MVFSVFFPLTSTVRDPWPYIVSNPQTSQTAELMVLTCCDTLPRAPEWPASTMLPISGSFVLATYWGTYLRINLTASARKSSAPPGLAKMPMSALTPLPGAGPIVGAQLFQRQGCI